MPPKHVVRQPSQTNSNDHVLREQKNIFDIMILWRQGRRMLWYVCGFVCFGCTPATYTRNCTGTHNYSNSGQTFVNTLQSDVSVFGLTRSLYSMRFTVRGSDCVRNLFTEATGFLAVALLDLYHNCWQEASSAFYPIQNEFRGRKAEVLSMSVTRNKGQQWK